MVFKACFTAAAARAAAAAAACFWGISPKAAVELSLSEAEGLTPVRDVQYISSNAMAYDLWGAAAAVEFAGLVGGDVGTENSTTGTEAPVTLDSLPFVRSLAFPLRTGFAAARGPMSQPRDGTCCEPPGKRR